MQTRDFDKLSGTDFELALKELLTNQGYEELQYTPKSADFGVDVVALRAGRRHAIQVKRSSSPIGIAAVQQVIGGKIYYDCETASVISNASFTPSARELAAKAGVELVDRPELKKWIARLKLSGHLGDLAPRPYQQEALDNLAGLRKRRASKALVVMASGLGKTLLSAFDVRQFESELGQPAKVLFLAHQGVILEQAARSFLRLFGSHRTYGRFDGEARQLGADFTFATFQSAYTSRQAFDAAGYDYIVVDEAHHTAAPTRDAVVSSFKPRFLLGLTATPNRYDGKDVNLFYDDNVALSLPLERALAEGLLTPIDYRVYSDKADARVLARLLSSREASEDGLFTPRSDKEVVALIARARQAIPESRTIVFCSTLDQMDRFAGYFDSTVCVSGREHRGEQVRRIDQFIAGERTVLLARDVLNEGIDVPSANLLVFLRNSESPVVFLQQLGRGLRKDPSKARVVVLDFVCNIDRIKYVYSFCSRLVSQGTGRRPELRPGSALPSASTIELDENAREVVRTLLQKKEQSGLIVPLDALQAAFDFKVGVETFRKLVRIGTLVPDYEIAGPNGGTLYFEHVTVQRFARAVLSTSAHGGLLAEGQFAKLAGQSVSRLRSAEKWGRFCPSWFHRNSAGKFTFFYSAQDVAELTTVSPTEGGMRSSGSVAPAV